MSQKQKLELTWIGKENRPQLEPRIRIDCADDPTAELSRVLSQEATLNVCREPRCGCTSIHFSFPLAPAATNAAPFAPGTDFWLDLDQQPIVPDPALERDPVSRHLAQVIRQHLSETDRQQLREWFLAKKLAIIQSTPVSEMDLADLPDADGGKLIGFVDVFPCGLALNFPLDGEIWSVDEQYCVQPGCQCAETVLSFLKLRDRSGRQISLSQEAPSIRYNYRSQMTKPVVSGPSTSLSPEVLLGTVQGAHATLDVQLELRHLILRSLYARQYTERLESQLQSLSVRLPRKVSRNAPCPCGSGRKYKHCCLNKPRTES